MLAKWLAKSDQINMPISSSRNELYHGTTRQSESKKKGEDNFELENKRCDIAVFAIFLSLRAREETEVTFRELSSEK